MSSENNNALPNPASGPNDASVRLASLPDREPILERLMAEAIDEPHVRLSRPRAQFTFFCGFEPQQANGYEGQLEAVGRCLEWFVFDYIIPDFNLTPAQHWFDQNKLLLAPTEIQLVKNALSFVLGAFKITKVQCDSGFEITDLWRPNHRYEVVEKIMSQEIEPGQLLLARLFPHQGKFLLSGMATLMSQSATKHIERHMREGRMIPEHILLNLDGIELENLFNRSLSEVDRLEDLTLLHDRLRLYLQAVGSETLSYDDILHLINVTPDPFNVAEKLCDDFSITCRHEMDLVLAYMMATWFATHKPY
jgi:hypothetical protein